MRDEAALAAGNVWKKPPPRANYRYSYAPTPFCSNRDLLMSDNKKKHHVVPASYLAGFVDGAGKLYEYRKDDPEKPNYNIPKAVGHRRYYYSQPKPDGGRDHNSLEDLFDRELESKWNGVCSKIREGIRLSPNDLRVLLGFVTMLRVRVPAARDSVEHRLAESVKTSFLLLDSMGEFSPRPPQLEGIDLAKILKISIDPHKSIHAMVDMMRGFGAVIDAVGFRIFENKTSIPFLTSDNPVANFDPDVPEEKMLPYAISPNLRRIELIFPIDKKYVLHGHSDYRVSYVYDGIVYEALDDKACVKRFNRLICKFGYEKIFSCNREHEALIIKYSPLSPVAKIDSIPHNKGVYLLDTQVFGKRTKLPKWKLKN